MMPASLFKQLLLPLYPRLQRVALRLLGNAEDAEDMVQEVYLKLWSKRDTLPEVKDMEALRKETEFITKNEAFECIKSKQKTKEHATRKEVNGYEEIVRIKEDGQKMAVYMKEEEDARTEYVMIVDSPDDEYVIMIFTGELQPRDVQGLIRVE